MASRPVFVPTRNKRQPFVRVQPIEFVWFAGFSREQKQRSIASLHQAAAAHEISPVLEISSKSADPVGRALSAFTLRVHHGDGSESSLESAFQGSKVFEGGGPYVDLYDAPARIAKRDPRLRESGRLVAFRFHELKWALERKTAFYDWLYTRALLGHADADQLQGYNGFTDIEFNPTKSINCQARSAALFVTLKAGGLLNSIPEPSTFVALLRDSPPTSQPTTQLRLIE